MTLRTRMAIMVILFLLGCVFVAPYYRTVAGNSDSDTDSSLPTLEIQRPPSARNNDAVFANHGNETVQGVSRSTGAVQEDLLTANSMAPMHGGPYAINTMAAQGAATNASPFPDLKMPPPLDVHFSRTSSARSDNIASQPSIHPATQPARNPVRLLGSNIGAEVTWTYAHPSSHQVEPQQRRIVHSDQPSQWRKPIASTREQYRRQSQTLTARQAIHRIVNGDTLPLLSQQYYGRADRALLIFAANRRTLVHPEILPIGKELIIPNADSPVLQSSKPSSGAFEPSQTHRLNQPGS